MKSEAAFEPNARVAQRYHNTLATALYLGLSPLPLEKSPLTGQGPPYSKGGRRCLSRLEALDLWAEARMRASTSQDRAASSLPSHQSAREPRAFGREVNTRASERPPNLEASARRGDS